MMTLGLRLSSHTPFHADADDSELLLQSLLFQADDSMNRTRSPPLVQERYCAHQNFENKAQASKPQSELHPHSLPNVSFKRSTSNKLV